MKITGEGPEILSVRPGLAESATEQKYISADEEFTHAVTFNGQNKKKQHHPICCVCLSPSLHYKENITVVYLSGCQGPV